MNIPYDKTCRYEVQAQAILLNTCMKWSIVSEMSDPVTYGNHFSRILVREINNQRALFSQISRKFETLLKPELKCASFFFFLFLHLRRE